MKFQKDFLDKFEKETTIEYLMVEISTTTMSSKEKFKNLNQ
jgi:hypothetical protein